ncbi:MAG: histidine kinase dimerization/phospho-acceptor domain-containing protein, partial [Bacteroidota bacterium]
MKRYEKKLRHSRQVLQRKNQELDQVNANRDTFFYTVSHDLRNPLAHIKAIVPLLKNSQPEQVAVLSELLEQSTQRLEDILHG